MSMKYSGYFTKKEEDLDPVAKAVRDILNVNKTVEQIAKETDNGQTVYELELIVNGRSKDVLIGKQGNVIEVEEQVSMDSLPATVQEALKQAAGSGTIGLIESLSKNGTLVSYEAHVKHGKKRSEIKVGPNGESMK